jgi:hypothetical protein
MLTLFFITLAGMFNSIMDLCIKFDETIFSKIPSMKFFMDSNVSWMNKYKNGDFRQGSSFFLSTKALVFLTDMWHLCKTLMLICLSLAIVFYNPIFNWYFDAFIYWTLFGTSFTIFYDYAFKLRSYWKKPW